MLSKAQRTTILELAARKVSQHEIARVLNISRLTVRRVLRSNSSDVPEVHRGEKAEPYRQQILDLFANCKGNLVRVHEELAASGAALSYQALTAFCRRQGIGQTAVVPSGQYAFNPGEEMQHDTSPHDVIVGGKKCKAQTASGVLCYSHPVLSDLPDVSALRLQGVSERSIAQRRWCTGARHDRQHACGGVARHGPRDDSGA